METELHNPEFAPVGYIQVYTGEGKGKTAASLGLTLRALGSGWHVLLILFAKDEADYGDLASARQLSPQIAKNLTIVQAGLDRIAFHHRMTPEDAIEISNGWEIAKRAALSGKYNMIILDEVNTAVDRGLIPLEEVKALLRNKPSDMQIVLTGRRTHPDILAMAHLVSEISPVKHDWDIGAKAPQAV